MGTFISICLWGTATSGIYALMAVGVTLIFGISRTINFAHGALYMIGAYFCYSLTGIVGMPMLPSIVLSITATALVAIVFDKIFITPVRDRLVIVWMMTFAFAFFLREVVVHFFGTKSYSIPPLVAGGTEILGQAISWQRLIIIVVSIVCMLGLWWFIHASRVGKSLQAVAQNVQAANLVGIPVRRANSIVMGLSAGLAALAGILVAPINVVSPDMGLEALLLAFTIVILGGIGSIKGAIVASLVMGFSSSVVSFLIGPQYITFGALVVVLAVILFRPTGLFGHALEERA